MRVLEDSFILDFKSLILKDCDQGNFRTALVKVKEMVLWGQKLSLNAFSILVKVLCASSYSIGTIVSLLEDAKVGDRLNHETLILHVQALCISKASTVLDFMLAKNLVPCLDTSILSIYQLCLASKFERVVTLKEITLRKHSSNSIYVYCALMKGFCKLGMVGEAADIFQNMILRGLFLGNETCNVLVLDELPEKGLQVDGVTYDFLVYGYSQCKEMSRSLHYLTTMMFMEHKPNHRRSIPATPKRQRFSETLERDDSFITVHQQSKPITQLSDQPFPTQFVDRSQQQVASLAFGEGLCKRIVFNIFCVWIESVGSNGKRRERIIVGLTLTIGMLLICLSLALYVWRKKHRQRKRKGVVRQRSNIDTNESQKEDLQLPLFDLGAIVNATDNFSENNKLGEGGFGSVYKVTLNVKML
ncbi:Pentatricopeptide repeat-containing protein [Camellia lanceoleosa]|uniref:Pentatricopeptide repeat-containing protein n=1 Tax=Camellia lanceoleosa TaxID=1840588 RepID=A0ACC0HB30_9ERIC|nr:Pentatricopeptide repeat-containing protein [Camellia lanceoleosa]